jgi:cell division protein FtsQ
MRSVKIERAPRNNPRAQASRKPARTSRKVSSKASPRRDSHDEDDGLLARFKARIHAFFTHPILVMSGLFILFAVIAALFAGGYFGRAVHGARAGLSAAVAHAGFGLTELHINGLRRTPRASVLAALGMVPGQSIFDADLQGGWARLSRLPWVASVEVMRRYPNAIHITVVEKRPFALWKSPQGVVIVERNGKVITGEDVEAFRRLPKLVGAGAPETAADLVDAAQAHRAVSARIAAYARQSERRWNLILDDGVIVKLPESGWQKELDALEHLIIDSGILERDVTEIDLRSPTHYFFMLRGGGKKDVERGKET